jgi:putative ATP-dependent endonuclease of the OLD family
MFLRQVTIENFRGIEKVTVDLDETTVLIGENNCGKTSFIDALRLSLDKVLARRGNPFDDYDHRLLSKDSQPGDAGKMAVTLIFSEPKPDTWNDDVVQALADVTVLSADDRRVVTLRVSCHFDTTANDFVPEWEFLDPNGVRLGTTKSQQPKNLYELHKLCPMFYLSALRDAEKEFRPRSPWWSRLLRNPSMPPEVRAELERELAGLNERILEAEPRLQQIRTTLSKAQGVVELSQTDAVGIEALPARIWDILARAQVVVGGSSGANLPLHRHGSGTQSLSVIFLFEAFLSVILEGENGKNSTPVLALEEPEAHLHPCAIRSLSSTISGFAGQKIIVTHSGDLISEVSLLAIRRFHRVGGKVEVRRVNPSGLEPDDVRKVQFHILKTRGELLFARCWLLGEGVTEYWVLSETAKLMGIDLERHGIRIVPYRQVEADTFVKIANDLGIRWFCLVDNDASGAKTRTSLLPHLGGKPEAEWLAVLQAPNMEHLLCQNGMGGVYEKRMSPQKTKTGLTAKPGDPNYWTQVLDCIPNKTSKEELAIEAMALMRRYGVSAIPAALKNVITRAVAQATS